jgi:hypothetical protein
MVGRQSPVTDAAIAKTLKQFIPNLKGVFPMKRNTNYFSLIFALSSAFMFYLKRVKRLGFIIILVGIVLFSGSESASSQTELIVNGSFETGNFNGWTTTQPTAPFRPWAVTGAGQGGGFPSVHTTQPQSGVFSAWNGFDAGAPVPAQFTLFQDITIPAMTSPQLTWKDRVSWNMRDYAGSTQPRLYQVQIRNPSTGAILQTIYSFTAAPGTAGDTGWLTHTANLSAYAGQTIRLFFLQNIPEPGTGPGQFEIDSITTNAQVVRKNVPLDFTGDGRTDWATIANLTAPAPVGTPLRWKILGNPASAAPNAAFRRDFDYGLRGDFPIPRDYTGDRKTEVAVGRGGTPVIHYVSQFPTGTGGITLERAVPWGQPGDRPRAEGDYDGDGKVDYTVVRRNAATGSLTWYILSSSTNTQRAIQFGAAPLGLTFIATEGADFTGDGRDELVLYTFTANTGVGLTFYIGDANTGAGILTLSYGDYATDWVLPPADYTGDNRADIVVARRHDNPMTWYIRNTATGATTAASFGIGDPNNTNSDLPVRGDYDGDGRHDIAVYRQSNQTFYYLRSSSNNTIVDGQRHGDPGDTPLGFIGVE